MAPGSLGSELGGETEAFLIFAEGTLNTRKEHATELCVYICDCGVHDRVPRVLYGASYPLMSSLVIDFKGERLQYAPMTIYPPPPAPCGDTAHHSPEPASQATQLSALDGIAETLADPPTRSSQALFAPAPAPAPDIPKGTPAHADATGEYVKLAQTLSTYLIRKRERMNDSAPCTIARPACVVDIVTFAKHRNNAAKAAARKQSEIEVLGWCSYVNFKR
ncbi:hypothetical protein EDB85DRAFT_1901267 [Lactarius pseudohatsudake]|nr:hypothetical protein EDB85DRAFT_1901267 [Lactarius pseudohatsudake]